MPRNFYELGTVVPDWKQELPTDESCLVTLDKNGAWFASAASADLAHSVLENTGEMEFNRDLPGYWLIDLPRWNRKDIVSPIGRTKLKSGWVTTPTAALLAQLAEEGEWPDLRVHGSWTCKTKMRLNKTGDGGGWTNLLRDERSAILDRLMAEGLTPQQIQRHPDYKGFKDSFASALETLKTGHNAPGGVKEHRIYRPDWYHTIVSNHAANHWRLGWRLLQKGLGPVAMGTKDEITFRMNDWMAIKEQGLIKTDPTGRAFGHYKIKTVSVA
jgi:hypothetical protein